MTTFRQFLAEIEGDTHSLNRGFTFDQGGYGNKGLPVRSKWQQKDEGEDEEDDIGDEIDKPDHLFGFKGRHDELLRLDNKGKRPSGEPATATDTRRMMSKKMKK